MPSITPAVAPLEGKSPVIRWRFVDRVGGEGSWVLWSVVEHMADDGGGALGYTPV